MPTAVTMGITIGITRMIAAAECRNMPRMRKAMLSSSRTTYLSVVTPVMPSASACGSRASVRNVPISAEHATVDAGLAQLAQIELPVDHRAHEQRSYHGEAGAFGRRDEAAENAAEDDQ